jgi:hypothetical protein
MSWLTDRDIEWLEDFELAPQDEAAWVHTMLLAGLTVDEGAAFGKAIN